MHNEAKRSRDVFETLSPLWRFALLCSAFLAIARASLLLLSFESLGHGGCGMTSVAHGEDYSGTTTHDVATGIDGGDV